jgi:hypothetical protein
MKYILESKGLTYFFQQQTQCTLKTLTGRFTTTYMCGVAYRYSMHQCEKAHPEKEPQVCTHSIEEFFETYYQALNHESNQCPPASLAALDKMKGPTTSVTQAIQEAERKHPESCLAGTQLEGNQYCGFLSLAQACAHSCTEKEFTQLIEQMHPGQPLEKVCDTLREKSPTPLPKVSFISRMTTQEQAPALGAPEGRSKSAAGPERKVDETIQAESSGFLERTAGGLKVKYWAILGCGFVGAVFLALVSWRMVRTTKGSMTGSVRSRPISISSPITPTLRQMEPPVPYVAPPAVTSAPPALVPVAPPKGELARPCILSYMPRLSDELELHQGDQVTVWEQFEDGYAYGSLGNGPHGVFPMMCLVPSKPPSRASTISESQLVGWELRETMVDAQPQRYTDYTVISEYMNETSGGAAPTHETPRR